MITGLEVWVVDSATKGTTDTLFILLIEDEGSSMLKLALAFIGVGAGRDICEWRWGTGRACGESPARVAEAYRGLGFWVEEVIGCIILLEFDSIFYN